MVLLKAAILISELFPFVLQFQFPDKQKRKKGKQPNTRPWILQEQKDYLRTEIFYNLTSNLSQYASVLCVNNYKATNSNNVAVCKHSVV